jgi:hypothetical protein
MSGKQTPTIRYEIEKFPTKKCCFLMLLSEKGMFSSDVCLPDITLGLLAQLCPRFSTSEQAKRFGTALNTFIFLAGVQPTSMRKMALVDDKST